MYEKLDHQFINKKYIFLDCFDTLLYRNCSPENVIDRWLGVASEQFGVSKQQLKDMWSIVTHVKKPGREERSFKDVSSDLYNRILYCKNFVCDNLTEADCEQTLLKNYIMVETNVLKVNNDLIKKIRSEKTNADIKIFLISDFYMPKEFFVEVFKKFEIYDLLDEIIVSSEIGYRKSTSRLYKWVLKKYGLQPENILMIGDNKNSDILQAQRCGIQAYRIKDINKDYEPTPDEKLEKLFEENLKVDPLSNYAFSLFLFFDRIQKFTEINNITDIYFCSREGEYFKKEFDKLSEHNGNKVKAHYLLVSRKATFLPSLKPEIQEEKFTTLRNSSPDISIRTFVDTLGLSEDSLETVEVKDINKIIPDFFDSDEFKYIRNNDCFSKKYRNAVLEAKDEFWKYLYTVGISKRTSAITLVDIGWRGTIQDHISSFFEGSIKVTGLYFGLEKTGNLSIINRKIGLVYSDVPYKSRFYNIFSTNHRILERILQASHGSADHYLNGKCILSLYEAKEKRLYDITAPIKERISNTISSVSDVWDNYFLGFSDKQDRIALLHEAYLSLYTRKFKDEEIHMSNLMTMTFGTRYEDISFKKKLKNYYKMPGIEKKNKTLKMLRKSHLNLLADIYVTASHIIYRKRFLRMFG